MDLSLVFYLVLLVLVEVFLSPILFLINSWFPKHIVTTSSIFILINSFAGIIGQLTKSYVLNDVLEYWHLLFFVLMEDK